MISAAVKTSMTRIEIHQRWRSRRSSLPMSAARSLMVYPVRQRNRGHRFQMLPTFMIFPSEFFRRAQHRISEPFRRLGPMLARHRRRVRAALIVMGVWVGRRDGPGVRMPLPEEAEIGEGGMEGAESRCDGTIRTASSFTRSCLPSTRTGHDVARWLRQPHPQKPWQTTISKRISSCERTTL